MFADSIVQAFQRLVEKRAGGTVVISGRRRCRVAELDALARAAALALDGPAPARTPVVGLMAPNGVGFLASLLALRRAGCVVLLLDDQAPDLEAQRIAGRFGAGSILRCTTAWPRGPQDFLLEAVADPSTEQALHPDTAVIKLTSGSTGAPRGVAASSDALLADDAALTSTMGIGGEDRLLATIPFGHSYGLSSLAVPALVRGLPLVVPESLGPLSPLAAAAAAGATVFPTVPAYIGALGRLSAPPSWPATLRLVISAGAPLAPADAVRFRERYGSAVHVFYGASECGGICYDREGTAAERGTVGTVIDGVQARLDIVGDCEDCVVVRSPAVGLGYLPHADARLADGRFSTGDLGQWRDGELALIGRVGDAINVKGMKVDPREVEHVLAELPPVLEVQVFGVPGPDTTGELVRAVIACPPGTLDREEVVAWCRERLTGHKIPRSVVLVEQIPRTVRGKIDRAALTRLEP